MSFAQPWSAVLAGVSLTAIAALAALAWALAPFLRDVLRSGTNRQRRAVAGLILLAAAETAGFAWMAIAP